MACCNHRCRSDPGTIHQYHPVAVLGEPALLLAHGLGLQRRERHHQFLDRCIVRCQWAAEDPYGSNGMVGPHEVIARSSPLESLQIDRLGVSSLWCHPLDLQHLDREVWSHSTPGFRRGTHGHSKRSREDGGRFLAKDGCPSLMETGLSRRLQRWRRHLRLMWNHLLKLRWVQSKVAPVDFLESNDSSWIFQGRWLSFMNHIDRFLNKSKDARFEFVPWAAQRVSCCFWIVAWPSIDWTLPLKVTRYQWKMGLEIESNVGKTIINYPPNHHK